jgi:hypothetical protein
MTSAALLALILVAPTLAQQPAENCGPRIKIIYKLANQFLEAPLDEGIQKSGPFIFELWGNPETGTWTFIRTDLQGQTCILVSGDGLNHMDWKHPDDPA